MSFLSGLYYKSLAENEKNFRFWEDYLKNLEALDFSVFANKLTVPALVPIGSRIFFQGELKHTNEVTVALGADYFVKCSLTQAEVLRHHRIKNAKSKLDIFRKEREYIENQLTNKQNIFENQGHEIIEDFSEEEDKAWREKHRENVRKYKQNKTEASNNDSDDDEDTKITDEEFWNRLEELELQEELENELLDLKNEQDGSHVIEKPFVVKEQDAIAFTEPASIINERNETTMKATATSMNTADTCYKGTGDLSDRQTTKFDILQKVLDKQNELEEKLLELRNKDRSQSKTEKDLIAKLDEMEELDELEDEIDRLDDILQSEDVDSIEETNTSNQTKIKRSVSFADEDESETLELTFTHSDIEPSMEQYNPEKGIVKPSDIYEAHSNLFRETTSILKKSKYKDDDDAVLINPISNTAPKVEIKKVVGFQVPEDDVVDVNKTIIVKDVTERNQSNKKFDDSGSRPSSLFKKKRQQMKS